MVVSAAPGALAHTRALRAHRLPARWVLPVVGALIIAFGVGVLMGPGHLPIRGVVGALIDRLPFISVDHGLSRLQHDVLFQIRLPRVVLGGLVGAMLASGGTAYQGVFRNPLADPYFLGVSAGAGLGATIAIVYGLNAARWGISALPVAAFVGALLAVWLTYVLGGSGSGGRNTGNILLAGLAVTAFFTAAQTFIQQANSDDLRSVYAWMLGGMNGTGWRDVRLVVPYVVVSSAVLIMNRRAMDVLRVGEVEAAALGLHPTRTRLAIITASTMGVAAVVSVSGLIGFVGIVVPHTVRLTAGSSYRRVLPLSMVLGAAFLIVTDVLARTVVAPAELPIGVITAFCGAPFFVVVLRHRRTGS